MRHKLYLAICSFASVFSSGVMGMVREGGVVFWVLLVGAAIFAALTALVPGEGQAATIPASEGNPAAATAGGIWWPAVSAALLMYFLLQLYFVISTTLYSQIAGRMDQNWLFALSASAPFIGAMFAFLLGLLALARLDRPYLACLLAGAVFVAIVVGAQAVALILGFSRHLDALPSRDPAIIIQGLAMSLLIVVVALLAGAGIARAAARLNRAARGYL